MNPKSLLDFEGKAYPIQTLKFPKSFRPVIFSLFLLIGTWMACSLNPSIQSVGSQKLQGQWTENLSPEKQNPENLYLTKYSFRFECDSVFIITEVKSKLNFEDEPCFNGGNWKEYQKAGYKVRNDSLILEGVYTKDNFKMKISGCHHSGNFHESYIIHPSRSRDSLYLSSPHEHGIIHLFHEKTWDCKPHKL